jgi:hypothetical protein
MIFADSYFCIGKQHSNEGKPCQDYAVTQVDSDGAIAIISDGCSTGGKTDIGARIIACTALQAKSLNVGVKKNILKNIFGIDCVLYLGLKTEDFYATLGILNFDEGFLSSSLYGDGVIAYKNESEDICAIRYEWKKGAPYYLAYSDQDFLNQICEGRINSFSCHKEEWFYDSNSKSWEINREKEVEAGYGIAGFPAQYRPWCSSSYGRKETFLAIFSDGITQIKDVDWKDAVFEFMNYKTTSGEFVKRRMMKALKTMTPMDDISCAALRITPDADNEADTVDA